MIVNLAFGLCIGSLIAIGALMGLSILSDVLLGTGGGVAETCMPSFFPIAFGFLFLGWPLAYGHGGMVAAIALTAVVLVSDAVAALGLMTGAIDAIVGAEPGSVPIGTAHVRIMPRGTDPTCEGDA